MAEFLVSRGKERVSSVLFDLDGTLVDSIEVHVDSHFAVLASVNAVKERDEVQTAWACLLYTSPSPRDLSTSRMPSSA